MLVGVKRLSKGSALWAFMRNIGNNVLKENNNKLKRSLSFKDWHGFPKLAVMFMLFKCKFSCVLLQFDFGRKKF
jgi:hypothetical protein